MPQRTVFLFEFLDRHEGKTGLDGPKLLPILPVIKVAGATGKQLVSAIEKCSAVEKAGTDSPYDPFQRGQVRKVVIDEKALQVNAGTGRRKVHRNRGFGILPLIEKERVNRAGRLGVPL